MAQACESDRAGRWNAQAGQDAAVAAILNMTRGGFYIDLAANDPFLLSNTRTLDRDFGYRGVRR